MDSKKEIKKKYEYEKPDYTFIDKLTMLVAGLGIPAVVAGALGYGFLKESSSKNFNPETYVRISVKPRDTLWNLTRKCYGPVGTEDKKDSLIDAVRKYNPNKTTPLKIGEEIFVPFNKNNTNNLEECIFRAEKDPSGRVKLYHFER